MQEKYLIESFTYRSTASLIVAHHNADHIAHTHCYHTVALRILEHFRHSGLYNILQDKIV